jgi:hypothetical protein
LGRVDIKNQLFKFLPLKWLGPNPLAITYHHKRNNCEEFDEEIEDSINLTENTHHIVLTKHTSHIAIAVLIEDAVLLFLAIKAEKPP